MDPVSVPNLYRCTQQIGDLTALKLRGFLALGFISFGFLISDLVQRTVIVAWVWLRPTRRIPVLGRWINLMASLVVSPLRTIGGVGIEDPPRVIPCAPRTMILMNHQSIMDIPLMVRSVKGGYPRIVTRARYMRGIPLISHMVRLYQYPVVDPTANAKEVLRSIRTMAQQARESEVPIGLFPEGTRTRDGEIGEFKVRGLLKLLQQGPWTVHILVVDGYWKTARFRDFMARMSGIDGRIRYLGSMEWTDPKADPIPFMEEVREQMIEGLAELRSTGTEG